MLFSVFGCMFLYFLMNLCVVLILFCPLPGGLSAAVGSVLYTWLPITCAVLLCWDGLDSGLRWCDWHRRRVEIAALWLDLTRFRAHIVRRAQTVTDLSDCVVQFDIIVFRVVLLQSFCEPLHLFIYRPDVFIWEYIWVNFSDGVLSVFWSWLSFSFVSEHFKPLGFKGLH